MFGKTKDNNSEVEKRGKEHSKKMKGRTKNNNDGMAKMAKTLTGRTKEDFEHLKNNGEKVKIRYKLYPEKRVNFSQKTNILPLNLRKELVEKYKTGEKVKSIYEYIISLGYKMAYSSVAGMLKREIIE
jgi:hypothetical protein